MVGPNALLIINNVAADASGLTAVAALLGLLAAAVLIVVIEWVRRRK